MGYRNFRPKALVESLLLRQAGGSTFKKNDSKNYVHPEQHKRQHRQDCILTH